MQNSPNHTQLSSIRNDFNILSNNYSIVLLPDTIDQIQSSQNQNTPNSPNTQISLPSSPPAHQSPSNQGSGGLRSVSANSSPNRVLGNSAGVLLGITNRKDSAVAMIRNQVIQAITNSDLEEVRSLLAPFADKNISLDDQNHTPVHWAAALGEEQILAMLLQSKCSPHFKNKNEETPLHRAVIFTNCFDKKNFPRILSMLRENVNEVDSFGFTPLQKSGHSTVKHKKEVLSYYTQVFMQAQKDGLIKLNDSSHERLWFCCEGCGMWRQLNQPVNMSDLQEKKMCRIFGWECMVANNLPEEFYVDFERYIAQAHITESNKEQIRKAMSEGYSSLPPHEVFNLFMILGGYEQILLKNGTLKQINNALRKKYVFRITTNQSNRLKMYFKQNLLGYESWPARKYSIPVEDNSSSEKDSPETIEPNVSRESGSSTNKGSPVRTSKHLPRNSLPKNDNSNKSYDKDTYEANVRNVVTKKTSIRELGLSWPLKLPDDQDVSPHETHQTSSSATIQDTDNVTNNLTQNNSHSLSNLLSGSFQTVIPKSNGKQTGQRESPHNGLSQQSTPFSHQEHGHTEQRTPKRQKITIQDPSQQVTISPTTAITSSSVGATSGNGNGSESSIVSVSGSSTGAKSSSVEAMSFEGIDSKELDRLYQRIHNERMRRHKKIESELKSKCRSLQAKAEKWEKESESWRQKMSCMICTLPEALRSVVFMPCGHLISCESCAKTLFHRRDMCPICKQSFYPQPIFYS
eukprot:TRINITY_DN14705_c0_g1_i1.p1 TRINITY_DN14705_c0_g1~~TRINITY_DN14705_c0_g1_i1.p1  ORF type:complete len:745 (+),score=78.37 TRINITY_DN14705_c0_g1_i1:86-2320(+)